LAGLIGRAPVLAVKQPLDEPFDIGRLAQAQQVTAIVFFADFDDVLVAVAAVAPDHGRTTFSQLVE
jgi:hypothetical protein